MAKKDITHIPHVSSQNKTNTVLISIYTQDLKEIEKECIYSKHYQK